MPSNPALSLRARDTADLPEAAVRAGAADVRARVLAYYTAATPDFRAWSRGLNMHFGYWKTGANPFARETMLDELNRQVVARLGLPRAHTARVADLGGGTGATARVAVALNPYVEVDVVTLVPAQVELGREMNAAARRGDAITMHLADYTSTGLPAGAFDALCIVESACHAEGATKTAVVREAARLLKRGGTLVMVDAMLLRELPRTGLWNRLFAGIYDRWCECWAVPEMCRLDLLPATLAAEGFAPPAIEDWSWRIVPSVAHVPLVASRFTVAELVKARGRLAPWRWRHIAASVLTPLLGLRRSIVAYAAVTTRKVSRASF